jgi:hypothetical protein
MKRRPRPAALRKTQEQFAVTSEALAWPVLRVFEPVES